MTNIKVSLQEFLDKKTLILDLDETLVHGASTFLSKHNYCFCYNDGLGIDRQVNFI